MAFPTAAGSQTRCSDIGGMNGPGEFRAFARVPSGFPELRQPERFVTTGNVAPGRERVEVRVDGGGKRHPKYSGRNRVAAGRRIVGENLASRGSAIENRSATQV